MKHWINTLLFVSIVFYAAYCLADNVFYRYRDEDGTMTMASMLPPDRADAGYDIVDKSGQVVQTIPPKNTTLAPQEAEAPKVISPEEEEKRKDDLLLKSFTSQKEIERARDEKLASIKIFEGIVEENLRSLNKQLQDIKDSIAARKQDNGSVPANLQKNLDETLRQIKEGENFLVKKAAEKAQIQEQYDTFIKRFNDLHKLNNPEKSTENSPEPTPATPKS